jgi:serine/threonine-protein kinase HipA
MASLFVYMNGYEVGEYLTQKSGAQQFIYCDAWLQHPAGIPLSISMPLTEKAHKGDIVYNYFDNLLPDNPAIRNRIQERFSARTSQPFDLLSEIGRECIGAIQLLHKRSTIDVKRIDCQPLNEAQIAHDLRNHKNMPLGMSINDNFRISIAGVQEKTAFLWHEKKWQRPLNTTPTTHIFKLPIGKIEKSGIDLSNSVENEWLCLEILREFGLPVTKSEMRQFEDVKVLVVERFDRQFSTNKDWIIRHPQEDMCQASGLTPALKYENSGGAGIATIMTLLQRANNPQDNRKQFMKTVFIFWLLGAIDGHAKNFSIFLKQGGRFELTPVYDVISAYPLTAKHQLELKKIKMAMALHGKNTHYKWNEMMARHWFDEASRNNFSNEDMTDIITTTINSIESVIDKVSARLPAGFNKQIASSIFNGIRHAAKKIA